MVRRLVLLLAQGIFAVLLLGLFAGCGDQNIAPQTVEKMKAEIKAEIKEEMKEELKYAQPAPPEAAPAPAAAQEEEEDDEDKFGC